MEKLLREYAKRRGDAAGDPLEMHPATRKMLQGEVVRVFGKPTPESKQASARFVLWQRILWAGAAIGLLVFTASLLPPFFKGAKNRPTEVAAITKNRAEPQLRALAPASPTVTIKAQTKETETFYFDKDANLSTVSSAPGGEAVVAVSSPAPVVADQFSRQTAAPAAVSQKSELLDSTREAADSELAPSRRKPTVAAKQKEVRPPEKLTGQAETRLLAKTSGEVFASKTNEVDEIASAAARGKITSPSLQRDLGSHYRRTSPSSRASDVLNEFQIVWAGANVKIIDHDGSVYQGTVQAPQAKLARLDSAAETKKDKSDSNLSAEANKVSFVVEGENRTLHQMITFTGNAFRGGQEQPTDFRAADSEFKKAAPEPPQKTVRSETAPRSTAKGNWIQGSVTVGGTNVYQIRAVENP